MNTQADPKSFPEDSWECCIMHMVMEITSKLVFRARLFIIVIIYLCCCQDRAGGVLTTPASCVPNFTPRPGGIFCSQGLLNLEKYFPYSYPSPFYFPLNFIHILSQSALRRRPLPCMGHKGFIYLFICFPAHKNLQILVKLGKNCIVLYCIDGVVIAAQCTTTFYRSIVLPQIQVLLGREYAD